VEWEGGREKSERRTREGEGREKEAVRRREAEMTGGMSERGRKNGENLTQK
jgi:hypothetical protein